MNYIEMFLLGLFVGFFVVEMFTSYEIAKNNEKWMEAFKALNEQYLTLRKKYHSLTEKETDTEDISES